MTGLAPELPDTRRGCPQNRHAVPSPHTIAGPWPNKSLPSPEWPITGLPEHRQQPLDKQRNVDRRPGAPGFRGGSQHRGDADADEQDSHDDAEHTHQHEDAVATVEGARGHPGPARSSRQPLAVPTNEDAKTNEHESEEKYERVVHLRQA
jgi:hypothetical protein